MQTASYKTASVTKLLAILAVAIFVTGCVSAKSPPTEEAEPAEPVVAAPEPAPEPEPEPEPESTTWTVETGDNLWGIAGQEEVYNVPEKWPLIYKANLDQIEDADLIYPGQVLTIPLDSSANEVDAAIGHAKNRGAWTVGPIESSDQSYLNSSE